METVTGLMLGLLLATLMMVVMWRRPYVVELRMVGPVETTYRSARQSNMIWEHRPLRNVPVSRIDRWKTNCRIAGGWQVTWCGPIAKGQADVVLSRQVSRPLPYCED